MPVDLEVVLGERHRQARGHAQLFTHQIDTKDTFCHRVFDLQTGVHFDEIELVVLEEELDCASARVVDAGHGVGANLADTVAQFLGDCGARGLFKHLLVAAL